MTVRIERRRRSRRTAPSLPPSLARSLSLIHFHSILVSDSAEITRINLGAIGIGGDGDGDGDGGGADLARIKEREATDRPTERRTAFLGLFLPSFASFPPSFLVTRN